MEVLLWGVVMKAKRDTRTLIKAAGAKVGRVGYRREATCEKTDGEAAERVMVSLWICW